MTFRQRLVSELTQLDERESARKGWNRYALGHYLRAAGECADAVEAGADPSKAFARQFVPTSGMRRVAKRLGLSLDVQRGRWIGGGT